MEDNLLKPLVVGVGNTFINWYGVANKEFMLKHDLDSLSDRELNTEEYSIFDELKEQQIYCEIPGGTTMNTLRWINYVMKNFYNIENTTTFYGCISNDHSGQVIKDFLDSEGISNLFDEHDDSYSGQLAVVIVDSERYALSNLGVNSSIQTKIFTENTSFAKNCKIILNEFYSLCCNSELTFELWKYAHDILHQLT